MYFHPCIDKKWSPDSLLKCGEERLGSRYSARSPCSQLQNEIPGAVSGGIALGTQWVSVGVGGVKHDNSGVRVCVVRCTRRYGSLYVRGVPMNGPVFVSVIMSAIY